MSETNQNLVLSPTEEKLVLSWRKLNKDELVELESINKSIPRLLMQFTQIDTTMYPIDRTAAFNVYLWHRLVVGMVH